VSNPLSQSKQCFFKPAGKWMDFGVSILLGVSVFIVFSQTLRHSFVNYDDDQYFYANPHVQAGLTWSGVAWAFQTGYANNWHPLTWMSLMLDAQCFGPSALGPHLANVILHAANTVLLFLLFRRMTGARWRSAAVAVVFAIHPLRVESVAWVSERKDVLSAFFFMLTLLTYVRYVQQILATKARMFFGLALLFFALGLMSKPMLVTLPFVLLLLDWWPLNRVAGFGLKVEGSSVPSCRTLSFKFLVFEKWPFFLLSAGSCVATLLVQREVVQSLPLSDRLANAAVACMTYLEQMVWPVKLAAFYPYPKMIPVWQAAGVGISLLAITLLLFLLTRKFPYFPMGWLWYLAMLVPVIGFVQVGDQSHADRYTYLPQIGIYLILIWGMTELTVSWRYQRQLLGAAAVGTMVVLTICTWKQTAVWRDGESLWRHALACTSDNYTAENNLGYVLAAQGRVIEAIEHYRKALEINPCYAEADNNLGRIFLDEGRLSEAKEYFRRAIQIKPGAEEAHNNLGIVLVGQGDVTGAFQQYQKAIELNRDYAEVYNNLAILLASQGRFAESETNYHTALGLKPDYALARDNFGLLLVRQGRMAEAMAQWEQALKINPDDAVAHDYLGIALADQGRMAEAAEHFQKSLASAKAQGDSTLANEIRTHINFYKTNALAKP
jgi:tetratricopeptide (TPR) repeat protein